MYKPAITTGAFFAALAVILGAFGAHALKPLLNPDQLATYETAVKYQFYHSFGMMIVGMVYGFAPVKQLKQAFSFFVIGTMLFSGSLYAMTVLNINGQVGLGGLGIMTPIGGLFFILGWLFIIMGLMKK